MLKRLFEQIRSIEPNVAVLRPLLDPRARAALIHHFSASAVDALLEKSWAGYAERRSAVPSQEGIGARVMVHLGALTLAMYDALRSIGQSTDDATARVYDVGWQVYTKMGEVPWVTAEAFSRGEYEKLRFATKAFRTFPFDAPSYQWEDVEAGPGVVAFNCLRCPVAEYFRAHDASEVCVNTWCKLDYPLARQWESELERSGTIAGGAPVCDFRWQAIISTRRPG